MTDEPETIVAAALEIVAEPVCGCCKSDRLTISLPPPEQVT